MAHRTALVDSRGECSFGALARLASRWQATLATAALANHSPAGTTGPVSGIHDPTTHLAGARIAFLLPPGRTHVAVQIGAWTAGGIAVPLALSHPLRELEYILDDARPRVVVIDSSLAQGPDLATAATARGIEVVARLAGPEAFPASPPEVRLDDPALMIYTSGTTGRPKGVLTTHRNLVAQIAALVTAWEWRESDRILHTLPLHHIHGVVNALACALWSGARCEFGPTRPQAIWERLAKGGITLFMSVPTLYRRLIRAWEDAPPPVQREWSRGAAELRLMVSGSAALPVATLERWREITGHTLLERYGMTEIGMALSNPLRGERRPGHVGTPLPGVELRIVHEDGRPVPAGETGQIEVRGPQVFREYWRRPEETAAAFRDGWFRTGDEATPGVGGAVRILGRSSVDIVKTGGYKVSALEIEELYRTHPAIADLAVVGVPHPEWGEELRAAWVPAPDALPPHSPATSEAASVGPDRKRPSTLLPDTDALRAWGKERLAPYKVPHRFLVVAALPRNAMGKVQKPQIARILRDSDP